MIASPKNVRSTVLISSRGILKTTPHYEAYERCLDPGSSASLRDLVAGTWVPIELAQAHYRACETLRLSATEQVAMGRRTGERLNGTLLGTVLRLARTAGVTPWSLLEQMPRFWARGFDGGELVHEKRGPKEAKLHLRMIPLLDVPYFRHGLAGTCEVQLAPFCQKAYVKVEGHRTDPFVTSYALQWA